MKRSASSMKRRIAHGVSILPARHTDFRPVTLPFTKRCLQNWIRPAKSSCLSRATVGTREIALALIDTGFPTGAKPTLSCKAGVNERENV